MCRPISGRCGHSPHGSVTHTFDLSSACFVRCAGWAALMLGRRFQNSDEQDFSPARRGQRPWYEPDRGPTLKRTGGLYRRMEVVTMAVVAILIAAGVIGLIYLGLFVVVWAAWFAMSSA
jgi:hypothetical protein